MGNSHLAAVAVTAMCSATLLLGACADQPTSPASESTPELIGAPQFDAAGNSGCAIVRFNWTTTDNAAPLVGQVTGDLQGTMAVFPDLATVKFAGATGKFAGASDWNITGGILGPLAFTTDGDNMVLAVNTQGSPPWLFENIGKHRATGGVEKANLEYKGVSDAITGVTDHDYSGVICP